MPCKVLPLHFFFFSTQRWGLRALFFIFLAALCGMWDLPPNQGLNPCPLYWECGVLTTGLPGKSLRVLLKIQIRSCQLKSARTSPCIRDEFFTSPNPGNSSFTSLHPYGLLSFLPSTNTCSCFRAFELAIHSTWTAFFLLSGWCPRLPLE